VILLGIRNMDCFVSGFRAVNDDIQNNVPDSTLTPVNYHVQQYDLNDDEYNVNDSTFRPQQGGVYTLTASALFFPNDDVTPQDYEIDLSIFVNGDELLVGQHIHTESFFDAFGGLVVATGLLRLNAGDEVMVQINPTVPGYIDPRPFATHFEAQRLCSPIMNSTSTSLSNTQANKTGSKR
jgi:hypothetical protein